jgi:hypothetical protein
MVSISSRNKIEDRHKIEVFSGALEFLAHNPGLRLDALKHK